MDDDFNSHAHVERDFTDSFHCTLLKDFNSHAHVERDPLFQSKLNQNSISTHTLTWSVTPFWKLLRSTTGISTHTLTWSVTGKLEKAIKNAGDFNSHAHVERDQQGSCNHRLFVQDFNSHAHVERDT